VLLCPTCHTLVDKAPEEFPVDLLLKWKDERRRMLAEIVGVPRVRDRAEARAWIQGPLRTNQMVWSEYGPESAQAQHPDNEGGLAWRRKVLETILPNNRRILAMFDVNRELIEDRELEVIEQFRQHVDDLEARHVHGKPEPGAHRFPQRVEGIFGSER